MGVSIAPEEDELDKALKAIRTKVEPDPMDAALAEIRTSGTTPAAAPRRLGSIPRRPMVAEPDVTETRKTIAPLGSHLPGHGANLPNAIAESAMEMITHPVATARALAETPARAGYALGKYSRGEGSGREAAIGAAQTAAMLLTGPAERLAEPLVARVVGPRIGLLLTRGGVGAASGATFSPDRPAIGAVLGGVAGAVGARSEAAARGERFREMAREHPEWVGESMPPEGPKQLTDGRPRQTATATVTEDPAHLSQDGPDFTVDEPNIPPSPIEAKGVFGGALEQHGKDFAEGKIEPIAAAAEHAPPAPSPDLQTRIDLSRAKGWPDPTTDAVEQLGEVAWDISHEETARELAMYAQTHAQLTESLAAGIDPKTGKPWKQNKTAIARKASIEQEVAKLEDNYTAILGEYESTFGSDGLQTFHELTGLPAEVTGAVDMKRLEASLAEPVPWAPYEDPAEGPPEIDGALEEIRSEAKPAEEKLQPSAAVSETDAELANLSRDELAKWTYKNVEEQRNDAKRGVAKERLARSGFYDKYLAMGPDKFLELAALHHKISQAASGSQSAFKKATEKLDKSEYLHTYGNHELIRNAPSWFYKGIHAGGAYGSMIHAEKEAKRVAKEGMKEHKPGWSAQYAADRRAAYEKARDEVTKLMDEARAPKSAAPSPAAKPAKKEAAAAETYEYSSTQIDLPEKAAIGIKKLAAKIPDADLAADGREDAPHITVKYGLHGVPAEKVRKLLEGEPPVTVTLGETSFFPNGESNSGDVLKVDVDSPDLHRLNKKIADALPHTDTHPVYKPHATIAYLKPGLGAKYSGDNALAGEELVLDRVTFSGKDGKSIEIQLGKAKKVKAPIHDTARTDAGRLRDNLESVKDDGLITEMFRLLGAEDQTDQQRAIYRTVTDDPNMSGPITVPTIRGGRNLQAEALHRLELKKGAAARIEAVLNARGLKDEDITRRYVELTEIESDRAIEREGLDTAKGDDSFDFADEGDYTKGNGAAAQKGTDASAEGAPEGSAETPGRRAGEGASPEKGETSEVARKRAELYHQLHMASTPSARFNVIEQIKELDRPRTGPPVIKGAISAAEMAERSRAGETREAVRDITGQEPAKLSTDKKQSEMFGREVEAPPKGNVADDQRNIFAFDRSGTPERNGYDQAISDLWREQGRNGRLALLKDWARVFPEQQWLPGWADLPIEDLPEHARQKLGMERVNQAVAINDLMSRMRTGEGTAGAQFDKSLFKKLGANLYKGDIPSVIVKEGIQNAFDAVRPIGKEGRIHVTLNESERKITIVDNGHGMSPDVAANEFMDVGGSAKLEGSSGGFGLAKVGLLASAEHFKMRTVAKVGEKRGFFITKDQLVETTIEGSADDWVNGTLKYEKKDVDATTPTGTELSITIDKSLEPAFWTAKDLVRSAMQHNRSDSQLTATELVRGFPPGELMAKPLEMRPDEPLNEEGKMTVTVPGAEVEAIPSTRVNGADSLFGGTDVAILNNGLYQFSTVKSTGTGGPVFVSLNVKPTVGVDHPDYPFTTSREDLKGKVNDAIKQIFDHIATNAGKQEIQELIEALAAGIPLGREGKAKLYDTTGATPRATLEAFALKEHVHLMADVYGGVLELLGKAITERFAFPQFEFGGLSTSAGYLGVNISRTAIAERAARIPVDYPGPRTNIILINPWQMLDEVSRTTNGRLFSDAELAPALAERSYGTLVHEIAHQNARGHGEEFAGVQTRFDSAAVRVAAEALEALDKAWRVALREGIRNDVNTLQVEAWGRGKQDIFKKFAGHLKSGETPGDTGGLPGGGDAAAPHGEPPTGNGEERARDGRRRLGERFRRDVRAGARGGEVPRSHSSTTGGSRSARPGPGAAPSVNQQRPNPATVAPPSLGNSQTVVAAASRFNKVVDDVRKTFAPASRGPLARETANITREQVARMAHENEIARARLSEFAKAFDKLSREERLEFIDRMENPRPQNTQQLGDAADAIRDLLDDARDAVRSLGLGHLENFIANYFPHIWSDPEQAARIINGITGKRPMEGPRSFLKRRSIPTVKEGIEMGLEPITTNPVDLSLLKIREMNRYIMGQRVMRELKQAELAEFVHALSKAPEGYVRINDHVAMVYGPPDVPVKEAFDAQVRQKLVDVIKSLDPKLFHQRTTAVRGKKWGYATVDGKQIVTRFGGDATIIMHELGHALDFRFKLWDRLVEPVAKKANKKGKLVADRKHESNSKDAIANRKKIKEELRALADLRYESKSAGDVGPTYRKYVREKEEQIANAVHAYIYARAKMKRVAPTVFDRLDEFIKGEPKLRPLADVEPSLELESGSDRQPVGGLVVKGQYWAPSEAAYIINNYLSPGLRGNSIYDAYMGVGNVMNGAQLGFSAFHLGFTSMEAAVSRVALSLRMAAAGKVGRAAATFATAPAAPVTNFMRGRNLYDAYLRPDGGTVKFGFGLFSRHVSPASPEMTQIVRALVAGGGRVRMDNFYKSGAIEGFKKALDEHNPWGMAWRAFPAFIELSVKPVLEYVVPRQKMGVFYDHARLEIDKLGPNPDPADVRRAMAEQWDSVDNRMGQLVYDNLFWNKVGKDLSMASVRAVGWNLGTIREIGGGMIDFTTAYKRWKQGDEVFTTKMSYVVALPIFVGMVGAIYTYLATGEPPKELKDYYFPRTGRIGPDGNAERLTLPSYIKDVYHYSKRPIHTIESKLHPAIEAIVEMLHNQDFYGTMIVDPEEPLPEKVKEYAAFMARTFTPFGLRNALEAKGRDQSIATQLLNFVGLTPAPRELVRTPAQNKMSEYLARHRPEVRTPASAEKGQLHRLVSQAVRRGEILPDAVNEAMEKGELDRETLFSWIQEARLPTSIVQFKKLSLEEAQRVYELASDDEKAQWADVYRKKIANAER